MSCRDSVINVCLRKDREPAPAADTCGAAEAQVVRHCLAEQGHDDWRQKMKHTGDWHSRRGLSLVFVMFLTCCSEIPLRACTITFSPSNQILFRDAVLVYEAEALEDDQTFRVLKTWKGHTRDTLRLTFPRTQYDTCDDQRPTTKGGYYLVTVACAEPDFDDSFSCESRSEVFKEAVLLGRMRFLEEDLVVEPAEVVQRLRWWESGSMAREDLIAWLREMNTIAGITDWVEVEEFYMRSPTHEAIGNVLMALDEPLASPSEIGCRVAYFRESVLQMQLAFLLAESREAQDWASVEKRYEEIDSQCK